MSTDPTQNPTLASYRWWLSLESALRTAVAAVHPMPPGAGEIEKLATMLLPGMLREATGCREWYEGQIVQSIDAANNAAKIEIVAMREARSQRTTP